MVENHHLLQQLQNVALEEKGGQESWRRLGMTFVFTNAQKQEGALRTGPLE